MGVCLNKNCIKSNQQKLKESINIDINENKYNDKFEENKEKKNDFEENQLTDDNKKTKHVINDNGIIYYSLQSRFKTKLINYSKNGNLRNNYYNNKNFNIKNIDNCENLIHFTNYNDKKINNKSGITNTTTK